MIKLAASIILLVASMQSYSQGLNPATIPPQFMPPLTATNIVNTSLLPKAGDKKIRPPCALAWMAIRDPIANATHYHMGWGGLISDTTLSTSGLPSTCAGGTDTQSASWMPIMYDTRSGSIRKPQVILNYYAGAGATSSLQDIVPIPRDLVMLAGDSHNTTATVNGVTDDPASISFYCSNPLAPVAKYANNTIPNCGVGSLTVKIGFPNCWDGVNLDSANHRDHMAYASYIKHTMATTGYYDGVNYVVTSISTASPQALPLQEGNVFGTGWTVGGNGQKISVITGQVSGVIGGAGVYSINRTDIAATQSFISQSSISPFQCPTDHPVHIPTVLFFVQWPVVNSGDTAYWALSSDMAGNIPGVSMHGDYLAGFSPVQMQKVIDGCMKAGLDCGDNLLGASGQMFGGLPRYVLPPDIYP